MIQNGLILTGNDAEFLSRVPEEVKTKSYEDSKIRLDDAQALSALVSCFEKAKGTEPQAETRQTYANPFGKKLVLGSVIGRL